MATGNLSPLQKVLKADAAGSTAQKLYENTHIALAGLVPVALLAPEGMILRATDFALGVAVPIHAHVAINGVISDYVPKSVMGVTRWTALAGTSVALLGLLKLNLTGKGVTGAVKELWKK